MLQHKKQLRKPTYKAMRTHFRGALSAENSKLAVATYYWQLQNNPMYLRLRS